MQKAVIYNSLKKLISFQVSTVVTFAKDFDGREELVVELHDAEVQVEHQSYANRLRVELKKNARTDG